MYVHLTRDGVILIINVGTWGQIICKEEYQQMLETFCFLLYCKISCRPLQVQILILVKFIIFNLYLIYWI